MTITTAVHHPVVSHWPRTTTDPEELHVACTCGRWEYTSQETAGGGIEPWGHEFDQHIEEATQ